MEIAVIHIPGFCFYTSLFLSWNNERHRLWSV